MSAANSGRKDSVAQAIAEVESLLQRFAVHCLTDLTPVHYARTTGWQASCRPEDPGSVGTFAGRFGKSSPAQHHLEAGRGHAEALLVSERLGDTILSTADRDELTRRALGILPEDEAGRLLDILACPELSPRKLAQTAPGLARAVDELEPAYGRATALAFGQLVAAGLRTAEEFEKYGRRLDQLFARVTAAPGVAQWLSPPWPETPDEKYEILYGLLWHARDTLWRLRPNRLWTPFLLTQVIDGYLDEASGVGNSLGLALIDSIIISRLGFRPGLLVSDGILSIEVPVMAHTVYWDLSDPSPLSFDRPPGARQLDTAELFAFTFASLATMQLGRDRLERALEAFAWALELKPDSVDIRTSRAVCYLRHEMPGEAVKELKQVLDGAPDAFEAWHQLGNAYAMMSNWPRAMDAFRRAIKLKPDGIDIYNNMGIAYLRSGNAGQAIAAFETALEVEPDYYQAHFNLGNIHLENKEYERAVHHYREALRIEPGFVPAHYNLGQACYNKGDLDGAIRSYQRALDLNPKHFGAWHNLGIAYRDKGMTRKAVDALEKAVAINPNLMR